MEEIKENEVIEPATEVERLAAGFYSADVAGPTQPTQPALQLQRLEFEDMPGVSLTLPDACSPSDMVRIAAKIQERIGLHVIKRVLSVALGVQYG